MTLNTNIQTTYHVFDQWGMCVIPSDEAWEGRSWWKKLWDKILKREWYPKSLGNLSWRDSIGRTVLCWIAYGRPEELDFWDCVNVNWVKHKWVLYRHPTRNEKASRDHWSYFIIYNKLCQISEDWFREYFIPGCPRMRGMNLWMKSLTGDKNTTLPKFWKAPFFVIYCLCGFGFIMALAAEFNVIWRALAVVGMFAGLIGLELSSAEKSKRAEWWYYFWNIPGARLGNWWLKTFRKTGKIGAEWNNNDWINEVQDNLTVGNWVQIKRTPWQKIWARIIFVTIPAYPLHNKAWQLYVMPESRKKEKIKKILLKRVAKSNLMLRLLFGDEVTQEEVDSYPNMTGYRPSTYLDETCRRDVREMTAEEAEANCYEKDLIIWLWEYIIHTAKGDYN